MPRATDAPLTAGSGEPGVRRDPYLGCHFLVEIEGLVVGGFTKVSGLEYEVQYETVREGGVNDRVHRLPSHVEYPQRLVLEHGITDKDTLWDWHHDIAAGVIKRRNGSVFLLDNQGQPVLRWDFKGAYPVKWSGPALQADSDSVAVETIELVHNGINRGKVGGK